MDIDKDLNTDPGIDLPTDSNVSFNINSFAGNSSSIGTNIESVLLVTAILILIILFALMVKVLLKLVSVFLATLMMTIFLLLILVLKLY